ncbi:protein PFC0760c-like [Cydia pomonella]|uniref:protein PFC0760c-like n=1 Tax=Cydia pomonella TaxID=82600 RepID=UPI002ADD606C|nr:protein PFC0760c-like [Cydia pomonella]
MRIFLILFSAAIIIAFTDAQRKPNFTKPVVNLEKRPRTPLWHRPPEERRKLSIFPRNNMKFVVTPKPMKNDEPKESPTKRPLMRKFIMQDRNEKGTWSFAPREPLMKTQRFTVTLAPPKSSNQKSIDEMKSEESKKVPIVINNIKTKPGSSKHHSINKGNLIESMKIQKDPAASKHLHEVDQNVTKVEITQTTKVNDTQDSQMDQKNDKKTRATSGEDLIHVRSFNDDDVVLDANKTNINKDQNEQKVPNKSTDNLDTQDSEDIVENRAVDLNEIRYPIDHDNNSLNMDSEGANYHQAGQIVNFNDLEIMLEKIVNNTEESNISSTSDLKDNGAAVILNDETSIDEIPQFDITKPNEFYDVITVSTENKDNTNIKAPLNEENVKMHPASETNVLNETDINEHVADTLIVGNFENFINFIENDTVGAANSEMYQEQKEIVGLNVQEFKINIDDTSKHTTGYPTDGKIPSNLTNHQTESPFSMEGSKNNSDTSNALNLSLEIYESNMPLSIEEISSECDEYNNCNQFTPGKLNLTIEETSNEELTDNLYFDGISNKSTSGVSNEFAEERSNESHINKSDNVSIEQISNESSSNIAGEESNESYADKYNNLTDEIVSESLISSDNFTGEQFSNESSSKMAGEELSNETFAVISINSEEISRDSMIENFSSFSGEQISNESSNITEEETSNESYLVDDNINESIETADYLTKEQSSNESSSNTASEEISNESYLIGNFSNESIDTSYNLTEVSEELLSENSDNDERISDELVASEQGTSTEEIAEEALINRFKRSKNIIEEENLPTTVSGFKYTGHEVRLNHDLSYKNINA